MSEELNRAEQILTGSSGRPDDYSLRVAQTYAAIAIGRALESIAQSVATATGTRD